MDGDGDEPSARAKYSTHLREDGLNIFDVGMRKAGNDSIERAVAEGEALCVRSEHPTGPGLRPSQHVCRQIEADLGPTQRGYAGQVVSDSTPVVQASALAGVQ